MAARSAAPRLRDIIEAIERIGVELEGISLDAFEADWRRRWLVERGVEIISEASRRLSNELKARHNDIPWRKVAGVGNVLRHEYERAAAALEVMGLTISDAIRLLLLRVAEEKRLPFEVKVPNAKSRVAMKELAEGKGKRSTSAAALFKDLGI
jgi:addiction module RelB/DinJ family antitoxin